MRPRRVLLVVAIVLLGCWALFWLLFDSYSIPSLANAPTLQVGDHLLVRPASSAGRGDIVVYRMEGDPAARVSRVVAISGDSIEATSEGVLLNGQLLEEPHLDADVVTHEFSMTTVPEGHAFLMSDNRSRAIDSRAIGPVPVSAIRGRVVWICLPLGRFGSP